MLAFPPVHPRDSSQASPALQPPHLAVATRPPDPLSAPSCLSSRCLSPAFSASPWALSVLCLLGLTVSARAQIKFVGVSGESPSAKGAPCPSNVVVMHPGPMDVVLQGAWVVICPSLWQEAFGMSVVDALSRGLPVVASSIGGHQEAGLGACNLIPVLPLRWAEAASEPPSRSLSKSRADEPTAVQRTDLLAGPRLAKHRSSTAEPLQTGSGAAFGGPANSLQMCPAGKDSRRWRDREVPSQDLEPWVAALRGLLFDQSRYSDVSALSRSRAHSYIQGGVVHLQEFSAWLALLCRD